MGKKSLKTPLRYPGGKSRACTKMGEHFPDLKEYTEFREPFLGGGSVALYVTRMYPHLKVWVNDLYEPLANFWTRLQQDGDSLYSDIKMLKVSHPNQETAKELFLEAKKIINDKDKRYICPLRYSLCCI